MSVRRYYFLAATSIITIILLGFLGNYFASVSLLFNILMTLTGVIAGFVTNQYFAEKSERQNLGQFASAGYRLSIDIYDSLHDTIEKLNEMRTLMDENTFSKKQVHLMFDLVGTKLKTLQRFALSANNQWKDVLPPEQQKALGKRLQTYELSEKREVDIVVETHLLQ